MEEESWRRNEGGGIMEEESWGRNHGAGIMEEESWRRNQKGGIMEEESWRRHHGRNPDRGGHQGGLMGEESSERNHEMEAPRRHSAGTSTKQRLPRGSQKAPRRHPGGTQEAPRRHPGHPGVSKKSWEEKRDKTIMFYHRKWRGRPSGVHETSATLTKYRK